MIFQVFGGNYYFRQKSQPYKMSSEHLQIQTVCKYSKGDTMVVKIQSGFLCNLVMLVVLEPAVQAAINPGNFYRKCFNYYLFHGPYIDKVYILYMQIYCRLHFHCRSLIIKIFCLCTYNVTCCVYIRWKLHLAYFLRHFHT